MIIVYERSCQVYVTCHVTVVQAVLLCLRSRLLSHILPNYPRRNRGKSLGEKYGWRQMCLFALDTHYFPCSMVICLDRFLFDDKEDKLLQIWNLYAEDEGCYNLVKNMLNISWLKLMNYFITWQSSWNLSSLRNVLCINHYVTPSDFLLKLGFILGKSYQ